MTTRRNILLGFGGLLAGAAALKAGQITRTRPGTAFGTTVRVTVTARDPDAALNAAYDEIAAVHKAANLFDAGSEIRKLNGSGDLHSPSSIFRDLVTQSASLHQITGGAFDPTVQPLWQAWSKAKPAPSQSDIDIALRRVGWKNVKATHSGYELENNATLTFNGIAQGLASDRVLAAVTKHGATSAFIDTGEHALLNQDGALAIQHPRDGILGSIKLKSGFIAVSGDYASAFTPDFSHHHIFDPSLGVSPPALASVVVVAPSGAMADGLATAFMVMGQEKSMDVVRKLAGVSALFVSKVGYVNLSPGMHQMFQNT